MEPILFLCDVDGVLAPFGCLEDLPLIPIVEANLYSAARMGMKFRPEVIGRIDELISKGMVRFEWLTSWEEDAKDLFSGLGFGTDVPVHSFGFDNFKTWWKSDIVLRILQENPHLRILWVDDDIAGSFGGGGIAGDTGWDLAQFGDRLLAVSPSVSVGLTLDQLNKSIAQLQAQTEVR